MKQYRFYIWLVLLITLVSSCGGGGERRHVSDWSVTLDPNSDEPLGTHILVRALERAQMARDSDTIQILKSKNLNDIKYLKKNLLYVTNGKIPLDEYVDVIKYRSSQGYSTLLASNDFGRMVGSKSHPFSMKDFVKSANERDDHRTLHSEYSHGRYELPKAMCGSRFDTDPKACKDDLRFRRYKTLLFYFDNTQVDAGYKFTPQEGAPLVVVSVPLLFTNYSMLCKENAELLFFIMNEASDGNQNQWAACFVGDKQNDNNLYTYKGKNQYMRPSSVPREEKKTEMPDWLQTLLIIGAFIAFLLLCARRRERIVPYIPEPKNQTVGYARQVSLNYFWKKEYQLILRKKYVVFKDVLREKTHINLNDLEHFDDSVAVLAKITGMERNNLPGFFYRLQKIQNEPVSVGWEEMKNKIDKMNLIISKLK